MFKAEKTTYYGNRIFVTIKNDQGDSFAGVAKGVTNGEPQYWKPAYVSTMFNPVTVDCAKAYALALQDAIKEAESLDQAYPPGTIYQGLEI